MKKIGLTLVVFATLGASTMGMSTAQAAPVAVSGQAPGTDARRQELIFGNLSTLHAKKSLKDGPTGSSEYEEIGRH
ncbi:MAG TPA: hypothetical protein VNR65_18070 [Geobacterales bacterium]|nr:hypothetical protein [Geobacterales bacterium]